VDNGLLAATRAQLGRNVRHLEKFQCTRQSAAAHSADAASVEGLVNLWLSTARSWTRACRWGMLKSVSEQTGGHTMQFDIADMVEMLRLKHVMMLLHPPMQKPVAPPKITELIAPREQAQIIAFKPADDHKLRASHM
jgi:hypothetical protein